MSDASSPRAGFDHGRRLERAREELARGGWAGFVLTAGPNLRYLTGIVAAPSERLLALVLPVSNLPLIVAPAFERDRIVAETAVPFEIATWGETEDPVAIAGRAVSGGGWLLDPLAPYAIAVRFEERGVRFRSAGPLCSALRRRKEGAEIETLRRAQELTRTALSWTGHRLAPGITEREVTREILRWFDEQGVDGWALVQFGAGSALPHGGAGERHLAEECAVLVDLGAVVDGYHADLTRSWWFGERPPERYAWVRSQVEEAQGRAAALAGPGAIAGELDREARRSLGSAGLAGHFVHRLGHGVGLEIHEDPFLVEGSRMVLAPGDVFTIEPGVYLPGEFGVRLEDVWLVAGEGAEKL